MITDQPIGRGVLYVLSNVAPAVHAAFSEWCDSVHHFDTMRIEGFLSLRRFELVDGKVEPGVVEYGLLTLYQVADPGDADFSTPAYQRHTATYVPPPDGVVDGIAYERHVLVRRETGSSSDTQRVGQACVCLAGEGGSWLDDAAAIAARCDGVLGAHVADGDSLSVLFVDVETRDDGANALSSLDEVEHRGSRRSLQLFEQVYPEAGVLVRDRQVLAPRA